MSAPTLRPTNGVTFLAFMVQSECVFGTCGLLVIERGQNQEAVGILSDTYEISCYDLATSFCYLNMKFVSIHAILAALRLCCKMPQPNKSLKTTDTIAHRHF